MATPCPFKRQFSYLIAVNMQWIWTICDLNFWYAWKIHQNIIAKRKCVFDALNSYDTKKFDSVTFSKKKYFYFRNLKSNEK